MAGDKEKGVKSSKRKRENPCTPQTYADVKSLSYQQLVRLCKDGNISTKNVGRDALEVILCSALQISTTGHDRETKLPKLSDHCLDQSEVSEFEKLTPSNVYGMSGWTKSMENVPEIDVGMVKKYLLASNNTEFTKANLKTYKLSRSYKHLESKNVHSVEFNQLDTSKTFCIVKAKCNPSQSTENKRVKSLHVVLDKLTGEPYGAFCVCAVGLGQACSHVGALLFLLAESVASGEKNLPGDASVTEALCQWTIPRGAKIEPKLIEDVQVRQEERHRPTKKNYVPEVAPELSKEDNYQRTLQLLFDIRNANTQVTMPPIVNIIDVDRVRPFKLPTPVAPTTLPASCSDFDLPISGELTSESYPLPVYKFPHKTFARSTENGFIDASKKFIQSLCTTYNDKDCENIEKLTQGQSSNNEWMEQRKGAITGTKCHRILSYYEHGRAKPENIVRNVMQYDYKELKTPAVKWGVKNESRALKKYIHNFRKTHKDVDVDQPGLLVHEKYAYIRVSPDALVSCSCHGMRVVEIKCPYNCRNMDPLQAVNDQLIDYVRFKQGGLELANKHERGYFAQVQMQMGLSGTLQADFVVWTKVDQLTVNVEFDRDYWELKSMPLLVRFYENYVVTEILTSRIKNGLHLFSDEKLQVESEKSLKKYNQIRPLAVCAKDDGDDCDDDNGSDDDEDDDDDEDQSEASSYPLTEKSNSDDDDSGDENIVNDDDTDDDRDWTLGCGSYCRNDRAPQYSRVRDQVIACDANIRCAPNTWFHLFCEGFRRLPNNDSSKYVCTKCRKDHPKCAILGDSNGFLF